MPKRAPTVGSDATRTTSAKMIPTATGRPNELQTANVKAASTATIRIPTIGSGFPRRRERKRNQRGCDRRSVWPACWYSGEVRTGQLSRREKRCGAWANGPTQAPVALQDGHALSGNSSPSSASVCQQLSHMTSYMLYPFGSILPWNRRAVLTVVPRIGTWKQALAALFLVYALGGAAVSAAASPSCRIPGGHAVATGKVAKLIAVPTPAGSALVACIRRSGRKVALDDGFADARVAGRWVAWQRPTDNGGWRIAVHDLRT